MEPRSINLDGLRLSQPEGVWLSEIFPELKDGEGGLVGLEISLTSSQARVDLGASLCLLEFYSNAQSCRFHPHRLLDEVPAQNSQPNAMVLKDAFSSTSLVVVNYSDQSVSPRFELRRVQNAPGLLVPLPAEGIGAKQVREIDLNNCAGRDSFAEVPVIECSFGLLRMQQLRCLDNLGPSVAGFMLYRDVVTKRIISVSAL